MFSGRHGLKFFIAQPLNLLLKISSNDLPSGAPGTEHPVRILSNPNPKRGSSIPYQRA